MVKRHIAPIRQGRSLQRRQGRRAAEPVVLIACEGDTERAYFEAVRAALRLRTVDIPGEAVGHDPLGLVDYARGRHRHSGGYDHIICAFDRDTHARFNPAREKIRKLAADGKLPVIEAVTIPAFEFWILLHFERTTAPFGNADAVIARLKNANHIPNYEKADAALCRELAERMENAIANAIWLNDEAKKDGFANPFTNMHLALELLKKLGSA